MTESCCWSILAIDDDETILKNLKELLDNEKIPGTEEKIHIKTCNNFERALEEFDNCHLDMIIVDVRKGPVEVGVEVEREAGEETLEKIRKKKFLPVIFYTALPLKVNDLAGPHVKIISKPSSPDQILTVIKSIYDSPLPHLNRELIKHLERIQADYMWEFAENFHKNYGYDADPFELAYLLARRMSLSLSNEGIKAFLMEIGAPKEFYEAGSQIHPMQYYIIPPFSSNFQSGDLFFGKIETKMDSYWCLLTPSCDIEPHRKGKKEPPEFHSKAEFVVFAKCIPLKDQPEYSQWIDEFKATKKIENKFYEQLMNVLKNNRKSTGQPDRFVFLPGVLGIPDLLIDFQQIKIAKLEIVKKDTSLKQIASLDPPFSDAILSKFSRYFGRVGTPDLNCSCILSKHAADCMKETSK
jgi:CheY-like chemotaxis protein